MRFFADRTTTLLQIFHVIVDGLYDSVPILLSFMIVAFGAQEKDAGVILSVAALWVRWRAWARRAVRSVRFFAYAVPDHRRVRRGYAANTFSQNIWFSGFFFVIAMMGYACSTTRRFHILRCAPSAPCSAKCWGTSRP